MLGDDPDRSIVQRAANEALACQDMLVGAPVGLSLLNRIQARLETAKQVFAHPQHAPELKGLPAPSLELTH